ncbi:type IV leader peptidase family protein [Desmospora activa DSM 45169]|uniref:Type IV leader peptidase family protein n=2 Tax=Desmospora TaxID=500614 RepID=A0A2T4Z8Q2_9BACL|nr:type IV leader peptidase family protein [Desmospora activa DSM 45169]
MWMGITVATAVAGWWMGRWLPLVGGWFLRESVLTSQERRQGEMVGKIGVSSGAVAMVWWATEPGEWLLGLTFLFFLLLVVWTDWMRGVIPDRLNGVGAVVFLCVQGIRGEELLSLLMAAIAGFILLGLISLLSGGGMGGGDVKMAGAAGFALGWPGLGVGLALAIVSGGLTALWLWGRRQVTGKTPIPFGPHLALGFFIAFWSGEVLASWYLSLLGR